LKNRIPEGEKKENAVREASNILKEKKSPPRYHNSKRKKGGKGKKALDKILRKSEGEKKKEACRQRQNVGG